MSSWESPCCFQTLIRLATGRLFQTISACGRIAAPRRAPRSARSITSIECSMRPAPSQYTWDAVKDQPSPFEEAGERSAAVAHAERASVRADGGRSGRAQVGEQGALLVVAQRLAPADGGATRQRDAD